MGFFHDLFDQNHDGVLDSDEEFAADMMLDDILLCEEEEEASLDGLASDDEDMDDADEPEDAEGSDDLDAAEDTGLADDFTNCTPERLAELCDELAELDRLEPADRSGHAYRVWSESHAELKTQISHVQSFLHDMELQMNPQLRLDELATEFSELEDCKPSDRNSHAFQIWNERRAEILESYIEIKKSMGCEEL